MPEDYAISPKAAAEFSASITRPMEEAATANSQAMTERGTAAKDRFQELSQFCQSMMARNSERMSASIGKLSGVKSPAEFIEVQQSLLKETLEAALSDGQHLVKLNTAIFAAAFQPMQFQTA